MLRATSSSVVNSASFQTPDRTVWRDVEALHHGGLASPSTTASTTSGASSVSLNSRDTEDALIFSAANSLMAPPSPPIFRMRHHHNDC
jgi:hypothetical protein